MNGKGDKWRPTNWEKYRNNLNDIDMHGETSEVWCKKTNVKLESILDPDGWDREDFEYSFFKEKISLTEFKKRLSYSTRLFNKTT